jgi:DNA (cytosine-5)-methyltransferase 1
MIAARDNGPVGFPLPTHRFEGRVIGYKDKSRFLLAAPSAPRSLTVHEAISDLPRIQRGQVATEYDTSPRNGYQKARRARSRVLTLHKAANHSDKMMRVIRSAGPSIHSIPRHLISSGFQLVLFTTCTERTCHNNHREVSEPCIQQVHPPLPKSNSYSSRGGQDPVFRR